MSTIQSEMKSKTISSVIECINRLLCLTGSALSFPREGDSELGLVQGALDCVSLNSVELAVGMLDTVGVEHGEVAWCIDGIVGGDTDGVVLEGQHSKIVVIHLKRRDK